MAKRAVVVHVVPHIRWHREGRQTFQRARLRLVRLVDDLTDALAADSEQSGFILDGQAVLVEDYLELRPDREAALAELAAAGRLVLGPWYVTTDTFLVSPESLVRNLLHGAHTVSRLGPRLNVAYMPDTAGHIGQMPQIVRGFGIEAAAVARGLGEAPAELWWEGTDGSQVLLVYLRDGATTGIVTQPDHDALRAELVSARDSLGSYAAADALLLMWGSDQQTPEPGLATSLASASRRLRGLRAVPGSLPGYVSDVLAGSSDYPQVSGELRSPARFPLMAGTLSCRIWIKQRNHELETLLERWAEPFSTWAALVADGRVAGGGDGQPQPAGPLRAPQQILSYAWRLLLKNHTHDVIRGTAADAAEAEVSLRFEQAAQIADEIADESLRYLAGQVGATVPSGGDAALPLVVFNAAGHPQSGAVEFELPAPPDGSRFELLDEAGNCAECEVLAEVRPPASGGSQSNGVIVRFYAEEVPAFGYRAFALRPGAPSEDGYEEDEGLTIENEWLSVSADPFDGTLSLYDKRTGRSFSGLNRFRDGGDAGDSYNYCPPARDTLIDIPTNAPLLGRRLVGPVTQTLEIHQILRLPRSLTTDGHSRQPLAAQFIPASIHANIQLTRGVPRVDVEVTLSNNASDHRLRVHFPTGIVTQEAFFDGHYEVVRRPVALPDAADAVGWAEQPAAEQPQRAFVTVLGSDTGLTIANRGLPEVAVLAHPEYGTEIALTLLRSVGWLNREALPVRGWDYGPAVEAPGAQCQGDFTFHYSVIPHGDDPLPAWREAWAFQTPLRVQAAAVQEGTLPPAGSLVSVDNHYFVLSAVKAAEEGSDLIVRGYNISAQPERVTLRLGVPVRRAQFARLDEAPTGSTLKASRDGSYRFEVSPGQIVTLRFSVARR